MKQVKINLNDGNVVIGSIWRYSGEITEDWQIERSINELKAHSKGKKIKDFHVCLNDVNTYSHTDRVFVDIPAKDIDDIEFFKDAEVVFLNKESGHFLTSYGKAETWEEIVLTAELLKYENEVPEVICNIVDNSIVKASRII